MKKAVLVLIILFVSVFANAQFIDNYGFRIGAGLSNQYFEFKDSRFEDLSGWKENKLGLAIYINAEKKLNEHFSIRPELGYNQKGYTDGVSFTTQNPEDIQIVNEKLKLHNLSANFSLKITPFQTKVKPYLIVGVKGDYLISLENKMVVVNGETIDFVPFSDGYNKFVLSGLLGLGVEINDSFYLDIEYNPAITSSLDNSSLSINDGYIGVTVGANLNTFLGNK